MQLSAHFVVPCHIYVQAELKSPKVFDCIRNLQSARLLEILSVTHQEQELIQEHTLLQNRISHYPTGSNYRQFESQGQLNVGRVCNLYKNNRADPDKIADAIITTSSYISASAQMSIELEDSRLAEYTAKRAEERHQCSIK